VRTTCTHRMTLADARQGLMFEAMGVLGKNGVLILSSVIADAYSTRTTWYGGIEAARAQGPP